MAQTNRQFMFNGDLFQHNTSLSGRETYLRNGYVIDPAHYEEYLIKYRVAFANKYAAPLPTIDDVPYRHK